MTSGQPIVCKAAVLYAHDEPLKVVDVTVAPPRAGEVRIKVAANALCQSDVSMGMDKNYGQFPRILGHEAAGVVESVGEGVTSVVVGDHVVPGYIPQCAQPDCIFCVSAKTNLCPALQAFSHRGVMSDGTSRFTDSDGKVVYHFMDCSTFAEYTVVHEISCAKISKELPLRKACLLGCGVSTGMGAVWNTSKVEPNSSVGVWGLGAVGLAAVQAAKRAGATKIYVIDLNKKKFDLAKSLGATHCICPADFPDKTTTEVLIKETTWGLDYTFDCTGNAKCMREALESAHRGWGVSCVIGICFGEVSTRPFQMVTGRRWIGTAFGGWKTRSDVPKLVDRVVSGDIEVDHFITHKFHGVDKVPDALATLRSGGEDGNCLRAVVEYDSF